MRGIWGGNEWGLGEWDEYLSNRLFLEKQNIFNVKKVRVNQSVDKLDGTIRPRLWEELQTSLEGWPGYPGLIDGVWGLQEGIWGVYIEGFGRFRHPWLYEGCWGKFGGVGCDGNPGLQDGEL